jgi:hypothetical protein
MHRVSEPVPQLPPVETSSSKDVEGRVIESPHSLGLVTEAL